MKRRRHTKVPVDETTRILKLYKSTIIRSSEGIRNELWSYSPTHRVTLEPRRSSKRGAQDSTVTSDTPAALAISFIASRNSISVNRGTEFRNLRNLTPWTCTEV